MHWLLVQRSTLSKVIYLYFYKLDHAARVWDGEGSKERMYGVLRCCVIEVVNQGEIEACGLSIILTGTYVVPELS